MPILTAEQQSKILTLIRENGARDYIGEKITQEQHFIQTALMAYNDGASNELIIASYLHDIGHLIDMEKQELSMEGYGRKEHEQVGADFLRSLGVNSYVCDLVESHVYSKRYNSTMHPEYLETLSSASRQTLIYQGGKLTDEEIQWFESQYYFNDALKLRKYDDTGKQVGLNFDLEQMHNFFIKF